MMGLLAQSVDFGSMGAAVTSVVVFMIPIVAILTSHQRKMAELIHGNKSNAPSVSDDRLASLERQVAELSDLVRRQTLLLDDVRQATPPVLPDTEMQSRVGQTG